MPRTALSAWHIYPSARCNWQTNRFVFTIAFTSLLRSLSSHSLSLSVAQLIDLVYDSAVFRSDANQHDIYFFNILLRFLAHIWQCASKLALARLGSVRLCGPLCHIYEYINGSRMKWASVWWLYLCLCVWVCVRVHECACECAHKAAQIKLSTIVAATKADRGEGGRRETKESVELPARTRDGGSAATAAAAEQQSRRSRCKCAANCCTGTGNIIRIAKAS